MPSCWWNDLPWRKLLVATLLTTLALTMPEIGPAAALATDQPAIASEPTWADPQADLQEALARGDRRFVGLAGPDLVVPGVEGYAEKYQDSNGVRLLPVSDEVSTAGAGVLRNLAAYRYALRYNLLLLEQLRSQ